MSQVLIATHSTLAEGFAQAVRFFKPDADNILKSVLDALTGVAYEDDSQVTTAVVRKMDQVPADGTDVLVVSVRADEVLGGGDVVECELHEG